MRVASFFFFFFVVVVFCVGCFNDPLQTDKQLTRTRTLDVSDIVGDGVLTGASAELDGDDISLLIAERGVVTIHDDGTFQGEVTLGAAGLPDDDWHDVLSLGSDLYALIRDDEGWTWDRDAEHANVAFCVVPDFSDPRVGQKCGDGHGDYDCGTGYPLNVDRVTQKNEALGIGDGLLAAPRFYDDDGKLVRASVNEYQIGFNGSFLFSTADLDIGFTGIDGTSADGDIYGVDDSRIVRLDRTGEVKAVAHLDVDGAAGIDVIAEDDVAFVVDNDSKALVFYDLSELD